MDVRLDGKVALVTGGAGGVGRADSAARADAGARVAVADLAIDAARSVATELGRDSRAYQVDLRDAGAVEALVEGVVADLGGLDILLNVAGRSGRYDTASMAEADFDTIIDGNLKGTFLACKFAIPQLIARGGGRIINMGSNRGLEGQSRGAVYAASKGGVIALSRSLALELAPHRITVNVLAPGVTDTAMWRLGRSAAEAEAQLVGGKIGQPGDLAPLVVLLASDLGGQLTGMTLIRDVFMPR